MVRPLWKRATPIAITAMASAIIGAGAWSLRSSNTPPPLASRFSFSLPDGQQFTGGIRQLLTISPDGTRIIYVANARLYQRSLSELEAKAIPGGAPVTICPAETVFGMSWGRDGILFGQGNKGILRVSPNGGTPEVVVTVKPDEFAFGPQMLPDGQTILFTLAKSVGAGWDKAQIVAQSLKSGGRKILVEGGSDARYVR